MGKQKFFALCQSIQWPKLFITSSYQTASSCTDPTPFVAQLQKITSLTSPIVGIMPRILLINHDKQICPMINKRKGRAKRRCVTKHALQFLWLQLDEPSYTTKQTTSMSHSHQKLKLNCNSLPNKIYYEQGSKYQPQNKDQVYRLNHMHNKPDWISPYPQAGTL